MSCIGVGGLSLKVVLCSCKREFSSFDRQNMQSELMKFRNIQLP